MDPIDYSRMQTPVNIAADFSQGLQVAGQYQQIKQLGEERQLKIQQQQLAAAQQQAYKADITGYMANPTADGAAGLIAKYPQQAAALKSSWDMTNDKQKEDELGISTQAYSAANAGRYDIVQDLLQKRIDAKKNAGQDPSQETQLLDVLNQDPSKIKGALGIKLATVMGPDKFASAFSTINGENRQDAKAPLENAKLAADASKAAVDANVANATYPAQVQEAGLKNQKVQSDMQIAVARLGLDRDKLTTDTQLAMQESRQKYGQLPEAVMTKLDAATGESVASKQSATQLSTLADRITTLAPNMASGSAAKLGELFKSTAGLKDEVTNARSNYNQIVTQASMAAYKRVASGGTSDKDIDTAKAGVPSDTDPPEQMVAYLKVAAKLQIVNSVLKNAESEWYGANKFLGRATQDIDIDGIKVPKGMSFREFSDKYVDQKATAELGAMSMKQVQGRNYMRFASPVAPQGTY